MNRRPLTKSRHLTCVAGNYQSPGPSGRRRGNYSSELSGQSELPFGRRQTVQRAGGLPRRSSPGPAGSLTCRRRKIGAHDALPSRRRFCVFWESAVDAREAIMKNCRVGKGRPAGSIELRVSPSPSKIPYGGFSPVRLQMDRQWRPSTTSRGLSAVHIRLMRPSYTPPQLQLPGIRDPRRDYPFENLSVQCGTTPNN